MTALSVFKIVEHDLPLEVPQALEPLVRIHEEISRPGLGLYVVKNPQNVKAGLTRRLDNARKANIPDLANLEREDNFFAETSDDATVWRLHYYFEGKRWEYLIDSKTARYMKQVGDIPV